MKIKKIIFAYAGVVLTLVIAIGVSLAAFSDKGEVLGSSFTVGSANIKFLSDPTGPAEEPNAVDTLQGPEFDNIGQTWRSDYPISIWNSGSIKLALTSNADYTTANDPKDLRTDIQAEIFEWMDNGDGVFQDHEQGSTYGAKSIVKWKTEGIDLGEIHPGEVRKMIIRFSTNNLSNTKQGATALFDFEFNSIELGI